MESILQGDRDTDKGGLMPIKVCPNCLYCKINISALELRCSMGEWTDDYGKEKVFVIHPANEFFKHNGEIRLIRRKTFRQALNCKNWEEA